MLTSLEMIDSPRLAREEWRGELSWILPGAAASCRPAMAPPVSLQPAMEPPPPTSVTSQFPVSCLQQAAAISTGPDWTWAGERNTL